MSGAPNCWFWAPLESALRREAQNGSLAVSLDESGFYEVREGRSGGRLVSVIASNPPAEETRLEAFDPDDLRLATGAVDSAAARPDVSTLTPQETEKQTGTLVVPARRGDVTYWWRRWCWRTGHESRVASHESRWRYEPDDAQ